MMIKLFVLLVMIQCHIIDDYYLQGILARLKQKNFWQENAPQSLYKYDYICALICHSFSWTFAIMLPIVGYYYFTGESSSVGIIILFILNLGIHAFVDNAKANKLKINLCTDQILHLLQIIVAWVLFVII